MMNCTERWNVEARGFSAGINPLNYNFPILMIQLIAVFAISRSLHFILRPLSQPKFMCNILAGFILGPSVLGRIDMFRDTFFPARELPILHVLASFGVVYFLFFVSIKADLSMMLRNSSRKVYSIGISGIIFPIVTNICLYKLINHFFGHRLVPYKDALSNQTMLLSFTAFPHVAQLLDEINLLTSEIGHLAMSCAVVNDSVRIIAILTSITYRETQTIGLYRTMISLVVIILISHFVLRPIPKWIVKNTPEGKPVKETYVTALLIGALIMGALSELFFESVIIGVMFFGLNIPTGPPLGSALVKKAELMVTELFLPLFFVVIGLNIDVGALQNWEGLVMYILFFFGVLFGKIFGTLLPALLFHKMTFRDSATLCIMMNIKGLLEAMSFLHLKLYKHVMDSENYTVAVLCITALTAIAAPLITNIYKPKQRLHESTNKLFMRTIQAANKSVGELRILCCIYDEDTVGSIINLLEASNPSITHPISACMAYLVELEGRDAPLLIPYHNRELTGKTSKSDHIMNAFSKYSTHTNDRITIEPFTIVAPLKSFHDFIHKLAADKYVPLILVPVNRFRRGADHPLAEAVNPLNNLLLGVQEHAPCTVGILVNLGPNDPQRYIRFSYKVAVIFIGGGDDREALAYGIRMSEHPGVSIMVLRIFFRLGEKVLDKVERRTDDYLVNEYQERNAGNACALYCEEEVDDLVHAIKLMKSLESDYDLMMVGRRQCTNTVLDQEMVGWSENPELGVIGDVLVTYESIGGTASILVLRRYN